MNFNLREAGIASAQWILTGKVNFHLNSCPWKNPIKRSFFGFFPIKEKTSVSASIQRFCMSPLIDKLLDG
ncbi:hypothetical protein NEOC84_001687|nr:hypothetical protein [Neochlamydia sp. AcF84]